jgi:hypothetical protein
MKTALRPPSEMKMRNDPNNRQLFVAVCALSPSNTTFQVLDGESEVVRQIALDTASE